ncbi:LOW QUALITY PROTEIN: palmitoyltransferase ZDHHC11-like [Chlamydotis macqueenii]
MNYYDKRLMQTRPEQLTSRNNLISPPLHSRVNGSLPCHSFEFVAFLLFVYLATVGFGVYIPLLPYGWEEAIFLENLNKPVPVFNRKKHKCVIQNQHCYLCKTDV